ncbi:hypothetical protein FGB62_108g08 [Gracilaria domingensis]|nr:hypothetical protein FGB62_108g08 [Gracilaria domingensis]
MAHVCQPATRTRRARAVDAAVPGDYAGRRDETAPVRLAAGAHPKTTAYRGARLSYHAQLHRAGKRGQGARGVERGTFQRAEAARKRRGRISVAQGAADAMGWRRGGQQAIPVTGAIERSVATTRRANERQARQVPAACDGRLGGEVGRGAASGARVRADERAL